MLTIDRHFSKKRALVWSAVAVYSAAMLWALVMEAMRSFMPRGIAYATPFQWAQLLGTCGFLWLTLGYGAPLLCKGILGLRRAQQLWEEHCCDDHPSDWDRYGAAVILSAAMFIAALERLFIVNTLEWYRQLFVCLVPFAEMSVLFLVMDSLMPKGCLSERRISAFRARIRVWKWLLLLSSAGIGYGLLRALMEVP